jgi:hypothetical protein
MLAVVVVVDILHKDLVEPVVVESGVGAPWAKKEPRVV